MNKIIMIFFFLISYNSFAMVNTFDDVLKIKVPILKVDFFQTLGIAEQDPIHLVVSDFSCQFKISEENKKVIQFSLLCERALPQHLIIKSKSRWEKLSNSSSESSLKNGEFLVGNPKQGLTLKLNSLGNIITYNQSNPWKTKNELITIDEIMNGPNKKIKAMTKKKK